jgi:hypothetical protein
MAETYIKLHKMWQARSGMNNIIDLKQPGITINKADGRAYKRAA